jgi:hypothetical protein
MVYSLYTIGMWGPDPRLAAACVMMGCAGAVAPEVAPDAATTPDASAPDAAPPQPDAATFAPADAPPGDGPMTTTVAKQPRYAAIKTAARARGMRNAYLLAGIANARTGLAQCWSEATWTCQGPVSAECNGGPVIADPAAGSCTTQQGGLGMFQFDSGTYAQTVAHYGSDVLTIDGQVGHAIDDALAVMKLSAYTAGTDTDQKASAWLNSFDPANATLRDQWISTVVRYFDGCQPGAACWTARYQSYESAYAAALAEPGGAAYWATNGTSCHSSPAAVGDIEAKYIALGGCISFLGVPTLAQQTAPDGIGTYSVFENGSIYSSPSTGAHEVHGLIRDKWSQLGWEAGILGYPTSDEVTASDGIGRISTFQNGSIFWSPATAAHEVHGRIRDRYAMLGYEASQLGYPTSDEYAITGGRTSDFQHGSITWTAQSDTTSVSIAP